MNRSLSPWFLLTTSLLSLVACYDPRAQQSSIVREVESAGSGNLDYVTPPGLADFLAMRPALVETLNRQCAPLRISADAHWIETSEGKVCAVARTFSQKSWKADKQGW